MAIEMTDDQRRAFLMHGTRTGVLSTVRADGRPHASPIWFVLDGDDVLFTTHTSSLKGKTMRRTGRAHLTVDEAVAPYAFVTISGTVELSEDLDEMLVWATKLGGRYMGAELADQYGRRNAVAGELLVRLRPERIVAFSGIAE